jgi:hypothetical protein
MTYLEFTGLILAVQAIFFLIVFIIKPNFVRRMLARILALSFMFKNAGENYSSHFDRILDGRQPTTSPQKEPKTTAKQTAKTPRSNVRPMPPKEKRLLDNMFDLEIDPTAESLQQEKDGTTNV